MKENDLRTKETPVVVLLRFCLAWQLVPAHFTGFASNDESPAIKAQQVTPVREVLVPELNRDPMTLRPIQGPGFSFAIQNRTEEDFVVLTESKARPTNRLQDVCHLWPVESLEFTTVD